MAKVLKTHQAVPTRAMPPRRIVLGITGGIAAYKAAELTRALKKAAIEVQVVVTEGAKAFITPTTLQALSGNRVYSDLWDASIPNNMAHIELSRGVDAILVAPATADFMAKLANGLCNDLLSTLCIARNADECALLLAPAMNREMWENPATQRNVTRLRADGVIILGPDEGDQACGETGMGRMLEPEALLADVESFYAVRSAPKSLAGADITLISGPTALADPAGMTTMRVQTAADMHAAVMSHIAQTDLFFAVAAVADYTPAQPQAHKMKKSSDDLTLALQPTVDILATVAGLAPAPFCVGFAAESRDVLEYARKKRVAKGIPMIVPNLATTAIGADDNEVTIFDARCDHPVAKGSKAEIAYAVVNHAAGLYLAVPASLQQQQKSKHA